MNKQIEEKREKIRLKLEAMYDYSDDDYDSSEGIDMLISSIEKEMSDYQDLIRQDESSKYYHVGDLYGQNLYVDFNVLTNEQKDLVSTRIVDFVMEIKKHDEEIRNKTIDECVSAIEPSPSRDRSYIQQIGCEPTLDAHVSILKSLKK